MATIVRTLFSSKRRKTDAHAAASTSTSGPTSSSSSSSSSSSATSAPIPIFHVNSLPYSPSRSMRPPAGPRTRLERKTSRDTAASSSSAPDSLCTQIIHTLDAEDVRFVLVEYDKTMPVFDTKTVVPRSKWTPEEIAVRDPKKEFHFRKPRSDIKMIGNMAFGSVPTVSGSDSFKIHTLQDEEQMLMSKVFSVPKMKQARKDSESVASSDSETQSNYNTLRSLDGLWASKGRSTTATPESFSRVRHISYTIGDDDDERICGTTSLQRESFSPPYRLSHNRRRQMAHKTSLSENNAVPSGWKSRSRLSSCGSQNDEDGNRTLAFGVLFRFTERQFMFQHMPLIESELSRLESRITNAASNYPTFLTNVSKAWEELSETICQLHNAPRIRRPVWLSLNERASDEKSVASVFCNQLATLVHRYDTKNTKYFVSNLISTVLMHHMSWVASVASPPIRPDARANPDRNLFIGMTLNDDAPSLGYNAQLAQYLELSGSMGQLRTAKTVVCGDDDKLLSALCHMLSYFIRCSAIQHKDDERCWQLPTEQAFSPSASAATPDSAASPPSSVNVVFIPERVSDEDVLNSFISPSCSLDSLPSVTNHHVHLGDHPTPSITLMDRLELTCCETNEVSEELWSPTSSSVRPSDGLGRSLFVGPVPYYNPHFVVSALLKNLVNMNDTFTKMMDEVRCSDSASHRATFASMAPSSTSVCDVQMPDNVLILADTNDWTVKVMSSDGLDEVPSPSEAVVLMLEQFSELYKIGIAPHFLVTFLEDSLADILGKSLSLVEIVCREPPGEDGTLELSPERVRSIVGCDHSDLRLIVNVASVYWPPVLSSIFG
ncbi:unnamed protein product [Caenorhabditis auriculariae]|uniref:UDENN FNIP1/2-type domain-containing protein n=1 Tax=Caenorhabditis auriculariae TaxID=2777116 RepID=A0A8S1HKE7_9PELO|nr:unnamed protein product [Caenorhabditis auriculariae]